MKKYICKMAESIEEVCGRDVLINCMPNPPEVFFLLYNDAAKSVYIKSWIRCSATAGWRS